MLILKYIRNKIDKGVAIVIDERRRPLGNKTDVVTYKMYVG